MARTKSKTISMAKKNIINRFWNDLLDPQQNHLETIISRTLAIFVLSYCIYEFTFLIAVLLKAFIHVINIFSELSGSATIDDTPSEGYVRLALRNIINILIFFEILDTFKAPSVSDKNDKSETQNTRRNLRWVRIIFLVSIIAVLRKIILFDFENETGRVDLSFIGPSVILIVLIACYMGFKYIERKVVDNNSNR